MKNLQAVITRKIPALTDHTFLRYFSFVALYVAQGIPEGMTYFGIPAWMASSGKTPAEIGSYVAVIGIPWSFKILIAPFMDRFTYLAMGRRRPWVLFGQLGLMASFTFMSLVPDPLSNLGLLAAAGFFVSFFGAFQDVATDGMAIDVVPTHQQARANGLMWGAKTIGISASLTAGNWLINHRNFHTAIAALSICVCLIMLVPLLMRERPGEKMLPWTNGTASESAAHMQLHSWSQIFRSLFKVFILPSSFLMGVAIFFIEIGIGLMDTILPVFTIQEAGWTDARFSHIFSVTNIVAGILGMVAGGALSDLFGKKRMMTFYLAASIALVTIMAFIKSSWGHPYVIIGFIGIYYTLYVFLTIAIFATGMELCWNRISATQFTLYMAIANMGRAVGAWLLGPLKDNLPWEYVILSYAVFALAMLLIIQFLRLRRHQLRVEVLEKKHLDIHAPALTLP